MLEIQTENEEEFEKVRQFYHRLIDWMEFEKYRPGWKKGVYPSDEYLSGALRRHELQTGILDGRCAAAMIVNHECNEGYQQIHWPVTAETSEVTVIHALGVLPSFHGKGIAGAMVNHVIRLARSNRQKAVRLDVLKGNLPAEKLYTKIGFQYIDTVQMFYEDTGLTEYMLYEYKL